MRILIDLSPAEKDSVDRYVMQGRYANFEQFMSVAVRNQLLLEGDQGHSTGTSPGAAAQTFHYGGSDQPWLLRSDAEPPDLANFPAASDKPLPQFVTKLLPTKLVVRALLNDLVASGEADLALSKWAPRLLDAAVQLRGILLKVQEANPRQRGDQFHPGLPEPDGKSTLRFQTYYGPSAPSIDSQSLVMRLGFVATRMDSRKEDVRVALTPLGLDFARLPNDVLDQPSGATQAFTDAEQDLLVKAIRERSPGDATLMRWMLDQVVKGSKERATLTAAFPKALRKVVPNATEKVENSFFVATMSRLVELGAVSLEKDAQFTLYKPGPRAAPVAKLLGGTAP